MLGREEIGDVLSGDFGITLDAGRLQRPWTLAAAQHEAFARAPPLPEVRRHRRERTAAAAAATLTIAVIA